MAIETIWRGAHWSSPVTPETSVATARNMEAMGVWGTVIILSTQRNGTADGSFMDACDKADAVSTKLGNPNRLDQTIARLFHDQPIPYDEVKTIESAGDWLADYGVFQSLDRFIALGGRNIVLFNELNLGNEPQFDMDRRTLACFAYALNNAFFNRGDRLLYTLFPGPSGLIGYDAPFPWGFRGYFEKYDALDSNDTPRTFGDVHGTDVDPNLFNKTMFWHGGRGVFDRLALHCYAPNPDQFASEDMGSNPALESINWADKIIDPTSWKYITESGGQSADPNSPDFGDSYRTGKATVYYLRAVDRNNQAFWGERVRGVYSYILAPSNNGATSNGRHVIADNFIAGYKDGLAEI